MTASLISEQKKIIQGNKGSTMDEALINLPENASLKVLDDFKKATFLSGATVSHL